MIPVRAGAVRSIRSAAEPNSFRLETALFHNFCVNLRDFLCDVLNKGTRHGAQGSRKELFNFEYVWK